MLVFKLQLFSLESYKKAQSIKGLIEYKIKSIPLLDARTKNKKKKGGAYKKTPPFYYALAAFK